MTIITSDLPGVIILEPKVFEDARGFFYESFNERDFEKETDFHGKFVQDNHSHSKKNVLRGLHYQIDHPQGKLVRVTAGEILDVAVDIRRSSSNFGRWTSKRLSAKNAHQLWIPPGFAHGFLVLSEFADVMYKTTDYYTPSAERCIRWDDPQLKIDWQLKDQTPLLSAKDQVGHALEDAELFP